VQFLALISHLEIGTGGALKPDAPTRTDDDDIEATTRRDGAGFSDGGNDVESVVTVVPRQGQRTAGALECERAVRSRVDAELKRGLGFLGFVVKRRQGNDGAGADEDRDKLEGNGSAENLFAGVAGAGPEIDPSRTGGEAETEQLGFRRGGRLDPKRGAEGQGVKIFPGARVVVERGFSWASGRRRWIRRRVKGGDATG
jgi:hypothetical protein